MYVFIFNNTFICARKATPGFLWASQVEPFFTWLLCNNAHYLFQIVKKTFQPFVRDGSFPSGLIPDLLNRFSSKEGYTLFPDVLPFFEKLRKIKKDSDCDRDIWPWRKTTVGIITNSDDRVPFILESFGLRVGPRFHPSIEFGQREDSAKVDFDFVVLSYDVGEEKPHSDIFHAARKAAQTLNTDQLDEEVDMLYVGDEVEKDVLGALDAGWEAVLLEREGKHSDGDQGTYAHVRRGTEESSSAAKCTVVRNIGVIEPRLMALRQGLEPTLPLKT